MSKPDRVWPLLKYSPDPLVRSYLIHRLRAASDARAVANRLQEETDLTIRRALVLALGENGYQALSPEDHRSVLGKLREWYDQAPDPGLHAAAEWSLRQWKQDQWLKQTDEKRIKDQKRREHHLQRIRQELTASKGPAQPQWYVTSQGQIMIVIPGPAEFLMGSTASEMWPSDDEALHRRRIGRAYAIAAKPVTAGQYRSFRKDHRVIRQQAPDDDCPVTATNWYQAAEYCNWLSKQEGLPETQWCYQPNQDGQFAEGMKPAPGFLKRTGYRLPTEAEWEYACRAGAVTSRYYGGSEELLEKYGWYQKNSDGKSWPVGSLKPNDWGLFDTLGNVFEWCQDRYGPYTRGQGGRAVEDAGDIWPLSEKPLIVLRGEAFLDRADRHRSAKRNWIQPETLYDNIGFRTAKTLY